MSKSKRNAKIADNFEDYKNILDERKIISDKPIILEKKKSNKNWLEKDIKLAHNTYDDLQLKTQSNSLDIKDYKIAILSKEFCDEPLSRFDADGTAHTNTNSEIPLNERKIDTPHFHIYNEKGIEIAYKTEFLKNKVNSDNLQQNINHGIRHFCNEFNIKTFDEQTPEVHSSEFYVPFDTHAGIDFK